IEHRMTLARRVARYPAIARAVDEGVIGYESALLVSRVVGRSASDELLAAWLERARKRTVKHLREEIEGVLLAVHLASGTSRFPPSDEDLEAVFEYTRKIQSGELLGKYFQGREPGPQMSVGLITPGENSQRIHLSLSPGLYAYWQNVEATFRKI